MVTRWDQFLPRTVIVRRLCSEAIHFEFRLRLSSDDHIDVSFDIDASDRCQGYRSLATYGASYRVSIFFRIVR